jgi:YD repeat-containing protein
MKLHRLAISGLVLVSTLFLCRPVTFGETISYEYDAMGRLTKATYGSGAVIEYVYDKAGNRLASTTSLTSTAGKPSHTPADEETD